MNNRTKFTFLPSWYLLVCDNLTSKLFGYRKSGPGARSRTQLEVHDDIDNFIKGHKVDFTIVDEAKLIHGDWESYIDD